MKVETIVEEQSESRMNGEVSEQVSTEKTKLVNVSETNAENIFNNVSGVENTRKHFIFNVLIWNDSLLFLCTFDYIFDFTFFRLRSILNFCDFYF
jgi:hypothetical protein